MWTFSSCSDRGLLFIAMHKLLIVVTSLVAEHGLSSCGSQLSSPSVYGIWGFPCGSAGKESACNVGDLDSVPGLGRSPGEGKGYPLQCSGLENYMDCIVHGVAKSQTQLRDFHFHFM